MYGGGPYNYLLAQRQAKTSTMGLLGKIFYKTGKASATRPWTSIFIGLVIVCIGSLGFVNFQSTVSSLETLLSLGQEQLKAWGLDDAMR